MLIGEMKSSLFTILLAGAASALAAQPEMKMPSPFVNQAQYPLWEVQMDKTRTSAAGPLRLTEYVRATNQAEARTEAMRLHPNYSARAGIKQVGK